MENPEMPTGIAVRTLSLLSGSAALVTYALWGYRRVLRSALSDPSPLVRSAMLAHLAAVAAQIAHAMGKNAGQKLHETPEQTRARREEVPPYGARQVVHAVREGVVHGLLTGRRRGVGAGVASGVGFAAVSVALSIGVRIALPWVSELTRDLEIHNKRVRAASKEHNRRETPIRVRAPKTSEQALGNVGVTGFNIPTQRRSTS